MSKFAAFTATNTGYVRSINQDKALTSDCLIAVADGMGGHAGGEVAAKIAIETLNEGFQGDNSTEGLLASIRNANKTIMNKSFKEHDLKGMGTTLVAAALVVDQDILSHIVVVNIGDSRAYLLPVNGELSRLTEDHSLVEELVRRGEITEAQALVHPHRHILTRALGIDENVEIDAWELELDGPARVLLCSDGLTNECSEAEIGQLLRQYKNPRQAADKLVELALAHGGSDNVTVVVADIAPGVAGGHEGEDDEPSRRIKGIRSGKNADAGSGRVPRADYTLDASDKKIASADLDIEANQDETIALQKQAYITEGNTEDRNIFGTEEGSFTEDKDYIYGNEVSTKTRAGKSAPSNVSAGQSVKHVVSLNSPNIPRVKQSKTPVPSEGKGYGGRRLGGVSKKEVLQQDLPPTPLTFRVVVFAILFVSVFAGAAGAVYWYLHSSYYVGIDNGYVAIFQGRPGGFLSVKPTLYKKTGLPVNKVFLPEVPALKNGMLEPSLAKAETVVRDLGNAQSYLRLPAGNSAPAAETFFVPVGATPVFTKPGVGPTTTTLPVSGPSLTTTTSKLLCTGNGLRKDLTLSSGLKTAPQRPVASFLIRPNSVHEPFGDGFLHAVAVFGTLGKKHSYRYSCGLRRVSDG